MLRTLSRKKFLLSAGGAVSAAAAGGAAIGGLGAMASARTAPSREQDLRILGFLLDVERIELAFYEGAVRAGALRGELAEFAGAALIHERDHVATLQAALGTTPAASSSTMAFATKASWSVSVSPMSNVGAGAAGVVPSAAWSVAT